MENVPETCLAFDEDLSALVDGALPSARRAELEAHLTRCTRCREHVEVLHAVDVRLKRLPARRVPADLEGRLLARIAAERMPGVAPEQPAPARSLPRRRPRHAVALAAAAMAAAAVALWLGTGPGPSPVSVQVPAAVADLDGASDDELAAAIELETLQDFEVIANLDLLERFVDGENGRG